MAEFCWKCEQGPPDKDGIACYLIFLPKAAMNVTYIWLAHQ